MKNLFLGLDGAILTPVFVLVTLSLTTLFSISTTFFNAQLFFVLFSFVIFLFFSQVQPRILEFYIFPMYIATLIFLGLILVIGIQSHGAVRWLDLFGFRIQFSEIAKPFLIVCVSSFLSRRKQTVKTFGMVFCFLIPVILPIFAQPDLGNALLYFGVTLFSLFWLGFPIMFFISGVASLLIAVPFGYSFLHQYQKQRILNFLNPSSDPLGTSYNAIQSIIAVGSGGLFGKGLSNATQSGLRFLPERHTDFIFATISESFGLLGTLVILGAFGFLLYRIFCIFSSSDDVFCKTFALFSFSLILIQFFVNVGMNIGLLPIVGVTLPFISYGGSSLLSNFILLGLLSSISRRAKERNVLEIR